MHKSTRLYKRMVAAYWLMVYAERAEDGDRLITRWWQWHRRQLVQNVQT